MSHLQCELNWIGKMGFEAKIRDHSLILDSRTDESNKDRGPTPKEVLLASICGCSGIDVVSILQKMRVNLVSCSVKAETETTASYPSIFTRIKLLFLLESPDVKPEQALRAVTLSMTKYCGVSAMVVNASPIFYEVFVNGDLVGSGQADFSGNSQ